MGIPPHQPDAAAAARLGPGGGIPPRQRVRLVSGLLTLALLGQPPGCTAPQSAPPPRLWPTGAAPTWQWQLSGRLDTGVDAEVFVIDAFDTSADDVRLLRSRGRRVICHLRVGVHEESRPDGTRFPTPALGARAGPAGRRWLDIRRWDELRPVLADRLRLCRGKGFDGVALDAVDGYDHPSGFPLTFDDQLAFNRRAAGLARDLGLSPGLVDDVAQATALEPDFDFAVDEECVRLRRCAHLAAFVDAGKPVFHVEYTGATADFCQTALGYGFASMRKERDLGVWRAPCLR